MCDYIAVSGSAHDRIIEYVDHIHERFVDPVVSRRTTTVRPARHGNPGNERPVSSGADDVWQDLPPVTDAIAGIELRIDVFGWQRQPYWQA